MNNHYNVKIDLLDLTNPTVRTGPDKEWNYEITNPLGKYAEGKGYNGIIAPASQEDACVNIILFDSSLVK